MQDAVNSLRIVLAADESVRTGQVVGSRSSKGFLRRRLLNTRRSWLSNSYGSKHSEERDIFLLTGCPKVCGWPAGTIHDVRSLLRTERRDLDGRDGRRPVTGARGEPCCSTSAAPTRRFGPEMCASVSPSSPRSPARTSGP